MSGSNSPYFNAAVADAEAAGVPPNLFTDLIGAESGWNQNEISSVGAIGLGQVLPSTAANPGYGVAPFDPNNPESNLQGSAQYLAALKQSTGSWGSALNAYNTGNPNTPNEYPVNVNADAAAADSSTQPTSWLGILGDSLLPPQINPIAKQSLKQGQSFASTWGLRIGVAVIAVIFIGLGAASFMLGKPVSELPGINAATKAAKAVAA